MMRCCCAGSDISSLLCTSSVCSFHIPHHLALEVSPNCCSWKTHHVKLRTFAPSTKKSVQQLTLAFFWFLKTHNFKNPPPQKKGILKNSNWGGHDTPDLTNLRMTFLAKTKFEDYLRTATQGGRLPKVRKKPLIPFKTQRKKKKKKLQGSDTILNLVKTKSFCGPKKRCHVEPQKILRISINIDVGATGGNAQPSWQAESGPRVGEAWKTNEDCWY